MTTLKSPSFPAGLSGNRSEAEVRASRAQLTVPRQLLHDAYDKLRAYQKETNGKYPGGPMMQTLMPALEAALAPPTDEELAGAGGMK